MHGSAGEDCSQQTCRETLAVSTQRQTVVCFFLSDSSILFPFRYENVFFPEFLKFNKFQCH